MLTRRFRLAVSTALVTGVSGAALSISAPAHAGAFYIQEQSTRGAGRAFSGEVADTGPESLWWNPASIAESPATGYGSVSGIFPHGNVDDEGSNITFPVAPSGLTVPIEGEPRAYSPIQNGVVGALGYAQPIGDRFAIGVSVATPFELETKYGADSFARYDALKSRLDTADIQVTLAAKLAPWVDFGVGGDAVWSSARLTQASPNLPNANGTLNPDGQVNVTGNAWNAGWVVGAQFHPEKAKWRVGISYRSSVEHDFSGKVDISGLLGPLAGANVSTPGTANFRTPWIATVGMRYPIMDDALTLNIQVQQIGWSEFRSINIAFPGVTQVVPQNYNDTTTAAVGFDFTPNPIMAFRMGAQWDPTPTPNGLRTLRVPDSDRFLISAGGELRFSRNLTVETALEYVDALGSKVNRQDVFYPGTQAETLTDTIADISANAFVLSGGARWQF